MNEWRPGIEYQQLKGMSAMRRARLGIVWNTAFLASLFLGVALWLARGQAFMDSLWAALVMASAFISSMPTGAYMAGYEVRLKQEARAGYATARGRSIDLVEVDWMSSQVIRLAGEPRLSREEYTRRVALVRGVLDP